MIQLCTCIKRIEGQEGPNSCQSCGKILSVDELGGLSRRMGSATGSEISPVIDPHLKWKISTHCKPRALRRARTFTRDNRKNSATQTLKSIEDFFDKSAKREGDVLVSESEKFGVSLLGRRFSDNLETFPIKKRIISLLPSHSTPHILSSSDFDDHNKASSHIALSQNDQVPFKHDELRINPSHGVELDQAKSFTDEKGNYTGDRIGDSADFSGISILAAAACHSRTEKGLVEAEGPTGGNSVEKSQNSLTCIESDKAKDQPCSPELGNDKQKLSAVHFTTENGLDDELGPLESDEYGKVEDCGSLNSSSSKRKPVSSCDDRLHWDLNTVMDVWESQSDELSNVKIRQSHGMDCGDQGSCQDEASFGVKGAGFVASDNECISYSLCKLEEGMDRKHASVEADCHVGKHSSTKTQVCEFLQGKCQFKDAVITETAHERTIPEVNANNSSLITTSYPFQGVADLTSCRSSKIADLCEEKRSEDNCVRLIMEENIHNTLPSMVIIGNAGCNMHASDTFTEDKKANEMLHDESRSITTVDTCNNYSGKDHPSYERMGEDDGLCSPQVKKCQSLSIDVAFNVDTRKSLAKQHDHNICGMIIGENDEKTSLSSSKIMTDEGCLSDETAYADVGNTYGNANQSTSILFKPQGTCNELLTSRNACIRHYEGTSANVRVDGSKSSISSCDNLNASKSSSPFHTNPELMNSISERISLDTQDISALIISHGKSRTHAGAFLNTLEKDSIEEHFDYEHQLNASPIDTDHATGSEKVDFLGDDDSQYEDGELRESVLNSWGEDGTEEVETERVDYGSDCREADSFEAESDFCSQSDFAIGSKECKQEGRLISTCDGNRARFTEALQSKCSQTNFPIKDFSNVSYAEGNVGIDMLKDSGKVVDVNVSSEAPARPENRFIASNSHTDVGDVSGKASQPSTSKKFSGWDKLPRSDDAAVSIWSNDDAFVASSLNGDPARRRIVSSFKRDLSSRVGISNSSEAACRKEVFYDRENRKHDHIDLNAERSIDANRLNGRSRSFHSHGRGRVWLDPSDRHGSCRNDISGYYSSPKFSHSGPRNAAAAAVAKVESNGFIVAPDGTIVKGGSLGPGSHLPGHSLKSSSNFHSTRRGSPMESDEEFCMSSEPSNFREGSPGRCFNTCRGRARRYDSRPFNLGHGNRHHAPLIHESRIVSQPLQHPSSMRQRSFSPQRRPVPLSRELTRSPSRSRTRSPRAWTYPRGRNDGRINGVPVMKRQNRSPTNFNPQRRIVRQRSPLHRDVPAEGFSGYAPPSRNHFSPPQTQRWFDKDRIFRDHPREHQPRRSRERSPPSKNFSQSNRIDDIDSHGRMKPDECYEPVYSERFQEYAGYGRGFKHDGCGAGRRGKTNRYGMLHSERHQRGNGNMNDLHYDDEIRSHNLRPKLAFQRRKSPRAFDRGIDPQNEGSPPRMKGEMVHFRHDRDAKSNTEFKPFSFRTTSKDMALQRRPS